MNGKDLCSDIHREIRRNHGDGITTLAFVECFIITAYNARMGLLAGLSSLKVALPAAAEGAVAATAVDDGLAADEEIGDAL